jgi:hypothetical protein
MNNTDSIKTWIQSWWTTLFFLSFPFLFCISYFFVFIYFIFLFNSDFSWLDSATRYLNKAIWDQKPNHLLTKERSRLSETRYHRRTNNWQGHTRTQKTHTELSVFDWPFLYSDHSLHINWSINHLIKLLIFFLIKFTVNNHINYIVIY